MFGICDPSVFTPRLEVAGFKLGGEVFGAG